MDWIGYLEPRDRAEAKRTFVTLTLVATGVTLLFAIVVPPAGGPSARVGSFVVPAMLMLVALLLRRAPERRLTALWTPAPILGILAIAGMDLVTSDASAAGQVFLCFPVMYAASQLKPPVAIIATAIAILADATVVLTLKPLAPALTDLGYVSAALISMTALLIRAGQRQDALVAELRRQAAVDSLTGLVTRRVLDDAVRSAMSSTVSEAGTALVMLDIDRFKAVNDIHGHPVGDAALIHIARVLSAHTRPDTVICRIGGDEMAFLMPGCPQPVARRRAEDLVRLIRESPLQLADGGVLELSVSVGWHTQTVRPGACVNSTRRPTPRSTTPRTRGGIESAYRNEPRLRSWSGRARPRCLAGHRHGVARSRGLPLGTGTDPAALRAAALSPGGHGCPPCRRRGG